MKYAYASGTDLLTGHAMERGQEATIAPWDLVIVKEKPEAK
jgi:hypothetical protein